MNQVVIIIPEDLTNYWSDDTMFTKSPDVFNSIHSWYNGKRTKIYDTKQSPYLRDPQQISTQFSYILNDRNLMFPDLFPVMSRRKLSTKDHSCPWKKQFCSYMVWQSINSDDNAEILIIPYGILHRPTFGCFITFFLCVCTVANMCIRMRKPMIYKLRILQQNHGSIVHY
jgi:hypothetical protein